MPQPFGVDFEAHAQSMGAYAETVTTPEEFGEAFKRAKAANKTSVIVMKVDPYEGWTKEGHAWWEVGMPHISNSDSVTEAHVEWEAGRSKQRAGV